jgi:hypothetical protein
MSSYSTSREGSTFHPKQPGSDDLVLLGAPLVLLASIGMLALKLPSGVVLPALAMTSTLFALVSGLVAWRAQGRVKSGAELAAGIFAFAAVAACILGNPDQAALFLK